MYTDENEHSAISACYIQDDFDFRRLKSNVTITFFFYLGTRFASSGKIDEFTLNFITTTQNLPYDYQSLMHFPSHAYSINGKPTLKPLDESINESYLGSSNTPTEIDYYHIKMLYCKGLYIVAIGDSYTIKMFSAYYYLSMSL